MSDCANCPYISELRRELSTQKDDIKDHHKMIIELQKDKERNKERYNQIYQIISEMKINLADLSKSMGEIAIQLAENNVKTNENTRKRIGVKEIWSICIGGTMMIIALGELILKFK